MLLHFGAQHVGVPSAALAPAYRDAAIWDGFEPGLVSLCSPDPQAFRPPEEKTNVLQVSLPTNFKAARFESDEHTRILRDMQADIEAIRFDDGAGEIELPVKLKVHDSIFVPLAKWAMLLTGNYRCVQPEEMRSIRGTTKNRAPMLAGSSCTQTRSRASLKRSSSASRSSSGNG
jgi:hypothetical protein